MISLKLYPSKKIVQIEKLDEPIVVIDPQYLDYTEVDDIEILRRMD
jgi:hypothetical protein